MSKGNKEIKGTEESKEKKGSRGSKRRKAKKEIKWTERSKGNKETKGAKRSKGDKRSNEPKVMKTVYSCIEELDWISLISCGPLELADYRVRLTDLHVLSD